MDRDKVGLLHRAARALGLSDYQHGCVVAGTGGSPNGARNLDERGFRRVLAFYRVKGFRDPGPAPQLGGDRPPGMAGQPQANLIWRQWLDHCGVNGDLSREALDAWLGRRFGLDGGLDGLTIAGARAVIDDLAAILNAMASAAAPERTAS